MENADLADALRALSPTALENLAARLTGSDTAGLAALGAVVNYAAAHPRPPTISPEQALENHFGAALAEAEAADRARASR
jgi:hypothetical protein